MDVIGRLRRSNLARLSLVVWIAVTSMGPAQESLPTPSLERRVNRAIEKGAESLVKRQDKDGSWWQDPVHPLGRTALCTYALLHAGYPKDDPAVDRALLFLGLARGESRPIATKSVYETGCVLLLLNALGPKHRTNIHSLSRWLVEHFDAATGLWGYPTGTPDLSNTQYAMMGLEVGRLHGFKVPRDLLDDHMKGVLKLQHKSGAFRYHAGELYRATMTHAALLSLEIALQGAGIEKPQPAVREAMDRGHAWLEANFSVDRPPHGRGFDSGNLYYYLYGLERYAVGFDKKRIGEHDWYREGAEFLVGKQGDDGSWGSVEETCFAILFLRRAGFTEPPTASRPTDVATNDGATKSKPAESPRPKADVSFIRDWLVAGPFVAKSQGPPEDDVFYTDPVPFKGLAPFDDSAAGRHRWTVARSSEERGIVLSKVLPNAGNALYYAAVWLHVDRDLEAVLWVGSDDGCLIRIDETTLLEAHHHQPSGEDKYRVPLRLTKGRHLLLAKVENIGYDASLAVRFTDSDGNAIAAISASTRRDHKRP